MFDNIGAKIKRLAVVGCLVGIVSSIIGGIALLIDGDVLVGILVAVFGSLASWTGSFVLYGFGDVIETNRMILEKISVDNSEKNVSAVPKAPEPDFTVAPHNEPLTAGHKWRCESCGKMINKDICPYCGKAYGQVAEKIKSLDLLRMNGTITAAEYEERVEKLRSE